METTSECLIAKCSNITVTSQDIIVYVYEGICYRFNRQGKFINKIGRIGKGPGECTKTRYNVVDTVNQWVYIVDWAKFVKYDYAGNFITSYTPGSILGLIVKLVQPELFLFGNSSYGYAEPGQRFSLTFFSEKQKKYISKIACEKKDKIPFSICYPSIYNYNQKTFVSDFWSDTIYRVNNPFNLETYAVIQTGRFKTRSTADKSLISGKNKGDTWILEVRKMGESSRFIFITTNKGLFFYDKLRKKTYCSNYFQVDNSWVNFTNDITSFPIKPFSKSPSVIHNNTLISHNDAYEFFANGSNQSQIKLPDVLKDLSPEDNSVVVLIKLKQ